MQVVEGNLQTRLRCLKKQLQAAEPEPEVTQSPLMQEVVMLPLQITTAQALVQPVLSWAQSCLLHTRALCTACPGGLGSRCGYAHECCRRSVAKVMREAVIRGETHVSRWATALTCGTLFQQSRDPQGRSLSHLKVVAPRCLQT